MVSHFRSGSSHELLQCTFLAALLLAVSRPHILTCIAGMQSANEPFFFFLNAEMCLCIPLREPLSLTVCLWSLASVYLGGLSAALWLDEPEPCRRLAFANFSVQRKASQTCHTSLHRKFIFARVLWLWGFKSNVGIFQRLWLDFFPFLLSTFCSVGRWEKESNFKYWIFNYYMHICNWCILQFSSQLSHATRFQKYCPALENLLTANIEQFGRWIIQVWMVRTAAFCIQL